MYSVCDFFNDNGFFPMKWTCFLVMKVKKCGTFYNAWPCGIDLAIMFCAIKECHTPSSCAINVVM
jgi:hypothetical protein